MRISTIALATAFALSGTVALAQDAGGTGVRDTRHHKSHVKAHHTTVGMSRLIGARRIRGIQTEQREVRPH